MTDQLTQGGVNDYSAPVAMVCILITRMVKHFFDISQFYCVLEQTLYYSFTWNGYPNWYDNILGSQYYYCLPKSNTSITDEPTNPIRIIEEMCLASKVKNLTAKTFLCCKTNDSDSEQSAVSCAWNTPHSRTDSFKERIFSLIAARRSM